MGIKTQYKIEKGIPIPEKHEHYSKYPFSDMEVGDSFLVTLKQEKATSCNQLKNRIWNQAKKYCIDTFSMTKYTFVVDRINKTVRCFRIQ